jgi:hypothetical protein
VTVIVGARCRLVPGSRSGKNHADPGTKESYGFDVKENKMLAEGIKYVRSASPLHVSPTPEIEAAVMRRNVASRGATAA